MLDARRQTSYGIRRVPGIFAAVFVSALFAAPIDAVWVATNGDPLNCHYAPWPTPSYSICAEWVDDGPGQGTSGVLCCVHYEDLGSRAPSVDPGGCAAPRAVRFAPTPPDPWPGVAALAIRAFDLF